MTFIVLLDDSLNFFAHFHPSLTPILSQPDGVGKEQPKKIPAPKERGDRMKRLKNWWDNLPVEDSRFLITMLIQIETLVLLVVDAAVKLVCMA